MSKQLILTFQYSPTVGHIWTITLRGNHIILYKNTHTHKRDTKSLSCWCKNKQSPRGSLKFITHVAITQALHYVTAFKGKLVTGSRNIAGTARGHRGLHGWSWLNGRSGYKLPSKARQMRLHQNAILLCVAQIWPRNSWLSTAGPFWGVETDRKFKGAKDASPWSIKTYGSLLVQSNLKHTFLFYMFNSQTNNRSVNKQHSCLCT